MRFAMFGPGPPATMTSADLGAWKKHADRMLLAAEMFAAVAADSPCQCGECTHCQELAWLEVDLRTTTGRASERLAWLEDRVRSDDA